jgi:hypothetical protein
MNIDRGNQRGFTNHSGLIAVIMTLAFVFALGFGIWAFSGMQENKTNLDEKIAVASANAVQKAESIKETEFAEEQKNPYKTYVGSSTYGSLTFDYPKTWSIYAEEKTSGTILDFYGHPDIIPGLSREITFAFRAQILDTSYENEVKKFDALIKSGK